MTAMIHVNAGERRRWTRDLPSRERKGDRREFCVRNSATESLKSVFITYDDGGEDFWSAWFIVENSEVLA